MDYEQAYQIASRWMKNPKDRNFQAVVLKLDERDWGTVRDRIADALVAGAAWKLADEIADYAAMPTASKDGDPT